jgi:bifunctional DNA-binding transcriptional regulator/antitoxin component of YhaV-PrlF toxin-antitoxin module
METKILQIRGRGTVTLPIRARERYRLNDGDPLTFIDLDGIMLLAPRIGVVAKLAGEIEAAARRAGLSTEQLVDGVHEERRAPTS